MLCCGQDDASPLHVVLVDPEGAGGSYLLVPVPWLTYEELGL